MKFNQHYPLPQFQSDELDKIITTIKTFPLATIITQQASQPIVSQVPLILIEENNTLKLRGHFDQNNPHCKALAENKDVYCLFNGPNHYISPDIYPNKQFPGWNYTAVHIEGKVSLFNDYEKLKQLLLTLCSENESQNSKYILSSNQENFDKFIQWIVGFEIEIYDIKGIFKLSQDKGPELAGIAKSHFIKVINNGVNEYLENILK